MTCRWLYQPLLPRKHSQFAEPAKGAGESWVSEPTESPPFVELPRSVSLTGSWGLIYEPPSAFQEAMVQLRGNNNPTSTPPPVSSPTPRGI